MMQTQAVTVKETSASISQGGEKASKREAGDSFIDVLTGTTKARDSKNGKPEKENAGEQEAKAKQILEAKLQAQIDAANPIQRFLYQLVYQDPSTWTLADKMYYGVKDPFALPHELRNMLDERGLKLKDFSPEQLRALARLRGHKAIGDFLDALAHEKARWEQAQNFTREKPFARVKTSLQEIEKTERVSENQIIQEIVKQISMRKIEKATEIQIDLNPKSLGEVHVRLLVEGKNVSAQFTAESDRVAEILERHLNELHAAIAKQNLIAKSLEVKKSIKEE